MSRLLTLLTTLCIVGVKGQTGFRQLPSIIDCPNIVRSTCVSTGRGRTVLTVGDDTLFSFSHFEYAGGANISVSQLDGNVTAGNLSRSAGMECSDMTDYCYTMFVVVHLTEQTLCRVISCTTILLNNSEIPIGSFTASRSTFPSTPMNLRMLPQSESSVTFEWDPGSPTCNMNYSVTVQNCGTCDHDPYISRTSVTCNDLETGQQMQCSVTVRSVSECGIPSDPLTEIFEVSTVLSTERTTMATVNANIGAIVGGCIAVVAFIGAILLIVICVLVIRSRRAAKGLPPLAQNLLTPFKKSAKGPDVKHTCIPMDRLSIEGSPDRDPQPPPQLKGSVDVVGSNDPDNQPPGTPDHQNDPEASTDQPISSGVQAAAKGPAGQSLEQSQSKDAMTPKDSSISAAGAGATGTDKQEISKASDNSGGSKMVVAIPSLRPYTGTQHSDTTRTGLALTIKDFSEPVETGGESTLMSKVSEHNHDVRKEVYASSNGGDDTRDEDMAASRDGNKFYVAGKEQFVNGVPVNELKALKKKVEEQGKEFNTKLTEQKEEFNTRLTEQGKEFNTKLTEQKEEQKKEMDLKIQTLTTDIATLTAKIEQLTEMLRKKGVEVEELEKENEALKQENKLVKEEKEAVDQEKEALKQENKALKQALKQESQENDELKQELIKMRKEWISKTEELEREKLKRAELDQNSES